jgi:hypothetical protein
MIVWLVWVLEVRVLIFFFLAHIGALEHDSLARMGVGVLHLTCFLG